LSGKKNQFEMNALISLFIPGIQMKEKGLLQVYTGNGKGKTTAALGLALRAAGAGKRVFIAQFLKGMECCELKSLKRLEKYITVKQYGRKCFVTGKPSNPDLAAAEKGLKETQKILRAGKHDLVILDEANCAVSLGCFSIRKLLTLLGSRAPHVEVVVTGRNAHPLLLKKADLVTEMRSVRHYFSKGVPARPGIEK
jgi:cob(I)alamin adenosyltransferase